MGGQSGQHFPGDVFWYSLAHSNTGQDSLLQIVVPLIQEQVVHLSKVKDFPCA